MRYTIMIVSTLLVGAAMVGALIWFFRRLRRIEEEMGVAANPLSFRQRVGEAILKLRHHVRGG
jgi:hypothetical protein